MKRSRGLICLFVLVLIPSLLFAWTEPSGSTFTATTGGLEVKDILNNTYDATSNSLKTQGTVSVVLSVKESTVCVRGGSLDEVKTVLSVKESTTAVRGGSLDQVKTVNSILESSGVVKNFPTDYPDSTAQGSLSSIDTSIGKVCAAIASSVPVVNLPYANMNSSGTAGIITGATSGTITITEKVYNYSFLYKSSDTTHAINIKNSINRNGVYLFNYDENERMIPIPVAITFTLSDLLIGDTVQYDIGTLQP